MIDIETWRLKINITLKKVVKCFILYGILALRRRMLSLPSSMMTDAEFSADYEKSLEQKQASPDRDDFVFGKLWPVLVEKYGDNGSAKGAFGIRSRQRPPAGLRIAFTMKGRLAYAAGSARQRVYALPSL